MKLYAWYGYAMNPTEGKIHPLGGYVKAESETHALGLAVDFANNFYPTNPNIGPAVAYVYQIPKIALSDITE